MLLKTYDMQLWGWINSAPEVSNQKEGSQAEAAEGPLPPTHTPIQIILWDLYGWNEKKKLGKEEFKNLLPLDIKIEI